MVSERPAVVQQLEWRPSYWVSGSSNPQTDPVDRIVFSFFNDKLFRLVVDYDRQRTDGMTDRDMIDAIAAVYGAPVPSNTKSAAGSSSAIERESGTPISRWGDVDYSVVLFRTPYSLRSGWSSPHPNWIPRRDTPPPRPFVWIRERRPNASSRGSKKRPPTRACLRKRRERRTKPRFVRSSVLEAR